MKKKTILCGLIELFYYYYYHFDSVVFRQFERFSVRIRFFCLHLHVSDVNANACVSVRAFVCLVILAFEKMRARATVFSLVAANS